MDFRLSPHGECEMMRRGIPLALVQAVMEHSEQRIADESRLVRYIHQSRLPFKSPSSHGSPFPFAEQNRMGLTIPYVYTGIDHAYEPDFPERLRSGATVVLEIKGLEDDQTKAKHNAADRWVEAGNYGGSWAPGSSTSAGIPKCWRRR